MTMGKRAGAAASKGINRAPATNSKSTWKLGASEERYRRLFETAQDGIFILDYDTGLIADVNPFLVKMLGYPKKVILGKHLWDVSVFKNIAASKAGFLKLKSKGYIRYEDRPLLAKGGKKINVEYVSSVYLVNGKKVIQCNVRDITERKRMENVRAKAEKLMASNVALAAANEALRATNKELKATTRALGKSEDNFRQLSHKNELILGSAGEGIFGLDSEGKITFANPAAAKMLGWNAKRLVGRASHPIFHYRKVDGLVHSTEDEIFFRKDGTSFPVEYVSTPIRENGKLLGAVVAFSDRTGRRETENMLREREL
ncbi:MAG TPA: PAS domain S-box protein, partial [Candidatus Micrarchaeota archaeon]|nr:PAS domain S-box protein [Candidatus Micrarchaeota archaeon]